MATVRVFDGNFSLSLIHSAWQGNYDEQTANKCTVVSQYTYFGLELIGSNFSYDSYGRLSSGTIKSINIINDDGSILWNMSGLGINANEFRTAANQSYSSDLSSIYNLFKDIPLIVFGSALNDQFVGGQKADKFSGGYGMDTFVGGDGRDLIDGGGDFDIIDYSRESGGGNIRVNLAKGTVIDTYGAVDTVKNIELIIGTDEADSFIGSKTAAFEEFAGGAGNDTINGGGGTHNTVRYDYDNVSSVTVNLAGNPDGTGFGRVGYYGSVDTLIDIQDVVATNGSDTLVGSAENNIFTGLSGQDDINGGLGIDTADYYRESGANGVSINLEKYFGYDSYGYKDALVSIENVNGTQNRDLIAGSSAANVLRGFGGNDSLKGLAGNDRLEGGLGNDRLSGGLGNDILTGGEGNDTFVFEAALNAKSNLDRITDFSVTSDSIVLENAIFKGLKDGDLAAEAFYVGSAAHDASDRIIYNNKTGALLYDTDGKGGQAAVQFALLSGNLKITADNIDII